MAPIYLLATGGKMAVEYGMSLKANRSDRFAGRFVKWKTEGHDVKNWLSADNTGRIQIWDADEQRPVHSLTGAFRRHPNSGLEPRWIGT